MTRFNLVRLSNGDFILSAGSRIPVDIAGAGTDAQDERAQGVHPAIADLLLTAGNGMTVEAA